MKNSCTGLCLKCGKCNRLSMPVLDSFTKTGSRIVQREGFGIALDIGTTTVVMLLLDLSNGEIVARHSFMNPQIAFGADVISRIGAANAGKLPELHSLITDAVSEAVMRLAEFCGADRIHDMVIAGNTTMMFLLLGFPCESLGAFPFKPAYKLENKYLFTDIFGKCNLPDLSVRIVPWLSAFVGGDITAGLLHRLAENDGCFLLVDLGTNGELALYNRGELLVTSTAAGPAFEGGEHQGGASGVLSDLARLLREGFIDSSGLLAPGAPPLFTQKEVRNLQLAKSAVRTGVELLLESAGLGCDAPEFVYLAGGIGQAVRPEDAISAGLLPEELGLRVRPSGNTSLGGAVLLLLCPEQMEEAARLAATATEINLSAHPRFNECFVDYMSWENHGAELVRLCLEAGAYKAAAFPAVKVRLDPELRKLCEKNVCGMYGSCYACPPHVGEINELIEELRTYPGAVFWQNVYPLEDSFDIEGMLAAKASHNAMTQEIAEKLYARRSNVLILGAGGCALCEVCAAKTGEPCRHPEQLLPSLESYGVLVSCIEELSDLKYINGENTVTYFSGIFYK